MFIFANFLVAVASALNIVLILYMWLVIGRAILSWVSPDPRNPIVRFLYSATEPLLYRVRRSIPTTAGGLDLSPLLVIAAIYFVQLFLIQSLFDVAAQMKGFR
jgi:YggT family protein